MRARPGNSAATVSDDPGDIGEPHEQPDPATLSEPLRASGRNGSRRPAGTRPCRYGSAEPGLERISRLMLAFRRAQHSDVAEIVRLLADDPLGAKRERFETP